VRRSGIWCEQYHSARNSGRSDGVVPGLRDRIPVLCLVFLERGNPTTGVEVCEARK